MSNRNQRRKRHPIVRLLRSILRLIRVIFKPKQRLTRSIDRRGNIDRVASALQNRLPADFQQVAQDLPISTEQIAIAPAIATPDPFVETIGELFDRVQWQMLAAPIPAKVSASMQAVRTNLTSPSGSSLETVGELLDRVKWQISTTTIQEKVASTSRVLQTHDVSLN